jgi:hypothetical protein
MKLGIHGVTGAVVCALSWGLVSAAGTAERFPFVLPGDDASKNAADFSALSPKPAGADGFVTIRDGHFFTGDQRLRIWGMNVCFGANAPDKAAAESVAAHLAKLGLNGIRFHHHDSQPAPRGVMQPPGGATRVLDPEALDRQDFFLDQLNRHGIYANLNLHVGRAFTEAEGFAHIRELPYDCRYSKYLLYFEPQMRARFKAFIREYLGHVNPYRKLRRADDPGIAMLEITNENRFSDKGPDLARKLPEPYRGEFQRQLNGWLRKKYGSTEALRVAWRAKIEPPGPELARLDGAAADSGPWKLHFPKAAPYTLTFGEPGPDGAKAIRVSISRAGETSSTQELMLTELTMKKGRTYTLSLAVRAEKAREVQVSVSRQGPGNWGSLGFVEELPVGPQWQSHTWHFRATDDAEKGARLCFKFGGSDIDFWLADVRLREGGTADPVPAGQSLEAGTIDIPDRGAPEAAVADATRFMVETEEDFIRDITGFIRNDIGAKMPVTASQINYHGPRIVADTCAFADVHADWQHPRFPGNPWDRRNWYVLNTPMETAAGKDVLFERAAWRLLDRPYTMSEWNIPAPNDYAASVVPFAALAAALQDWDGMFFFQYSSDADRWMRDGIDGFFSFSGHPAKLALLGAFANLYIRGDLAPLRETAAGTCDERVPTALGLTHRIGIDPAATAVAAPTAPEGARLASPDGRVIWDAADPQTAQVRVNTPATRAWWGLVGGQHCDLGSWNIRVGDVERGYAVLVLTSRDGRPLESSKRMLLVAVGSAENKGMEWNAERTTVSDHWGEGPAQVNGIPAAMSIRSKVKAVYALDGCGARAGAVPVVYEGGVSRWSIGPAYRTLWYEIEAE